MARTVNNEPVKVIIENVDSLEGCSIMVLPRVKLGTMMNLDRNNGDSLIAFLEECIVGWEGFTGLPCAREGFLELDVHEVQAITQAVSQVVTNPPNASKVSG